MRSAQCCESQFPINFVRAISTSNESCTRTIETPVNHALTSSSPYSSASRRFTACQCPPSESGGSAGSSTASVSRSRPQHEVEATPSALGNGARSCATNRAIGCSKYRTECGGLLRVAIVDPTAKRIVSRSQPSRSHLATWISAPSQLGGGCLGSTPAMTAISLASAIASCCVPSSVDFRSDSRTTLSSASLGWWWLDRLCLQDSHLQDSSERGVRFKSARGVRFKSVRGVRFNR
jgi:hypothetical protein